MKYKIQGQITAPYFGYTSNVAKQVGNQHTGQDEKKGWNKKWTADNAGPAYKVWKDRYPWWQAVHQIVEDETGVYECLDLGHANEIFVNEGDWIEEGQVLGLEGNAGQVYQGGRRVTEGEKRDGSQAGAHSHRGRRPVRKVKATKHTEHYLKDRHGNHYQDDEGYYYEIIHKDNGAKGWVNPINYAGPIDRLTHLIFLMRRRGEHGEASKVYAVQQFVKAMWKK